MSALIWRILVAVIIVALVLTLVPPVFRKIGIDLDGDTMLIIRVCVAALAFLYIIGGDHVVRWMNPPPKP